MFPAAPVFDVHHSCKPYRVAFGDVFGTSAAGKHGPNFSDILLGKPSSHHQLIGGYGDGLAGRKWLPAFLVLDEGYVGTRDAVFGRDGGLFHACRQVGPDGVKVGAGELGFAASEAIEFERSRSMKIVFGGRAPFQILGSVVAAKAIYVAYVWLFFWVWMKGRANKTVHKGFLIQRAISVGSARGITGFGQILTENASGPFHPAHIAGMIAVKIRNWLPDFFHFNTPSYALCMGQKG